MATTAFSGLQPSLPLDPTLPQTVVTSYNTILALWRHWGVQLLRDGRQPPRSPRDMVTSRGLEGTVHFTILGYDKYGTELREVGGLIVNSMYETSSLAVSAAGPHTTAIGCWIAFYCCFLVPIASN